jgi:hypothetical protein
MVLALEVRRAPANHGTNLKTGDEEAMLYRGSSFKTLIGCARTFACGALPDPSVIHADQDAAVFAKEREEDEYENAVQADCFEVPSERGMPVVDVETWRHLCREALENRVLVTRTAVRS